MSWPVAGEAAAGAHYFKSVADYIHLNPARAGLAGGARKKDSHAGGAVRAHNEHEAERIIRAVGTALELSTKQDDLMRMKKGDRRKVICAAVVKGRTAVGNDWLAERLAMGHGSYVSTLVHRIRRDKKELRMLNKYDRI